MSPTDKEIKVIALARLLQDRISYIHEAKEKKEELDKLKTEAKIKPEEEKLNLTNEEIILKETQDLIPLVEAKIKEVATDLRNESNEENNEVINRLLSEADEVNNNVPNV
ncbi:hypothetical protein C6P40_001014 [Pichia californica]|uniref:Tubulin-specific chaperone A n=1 Tax=Pichia californica TaxID=460514 RepID=A0A9P6WJU3_9ASCO|nr:hypothetical protein C6P40_001014 [[Candida] californica]